jgi:hypothetical protein
MTDKIQDINTKIVFHQDSIARETKKGIHAINQITETGIKTLQDKTDDNIRLMKHSWLHFLDGEFATFKTKMYDAINEQMKELANHFATTKTNLEENSTEFAAWLDNKTRDIEQLIAAKYNTQLTQTSSTSSATQNWKQKPDRPSKLFPHVDIDQIWSTSVSTVDRKPNDKQPMDTGTSTDDWSYLGLSQDTTVTITHLPPLIPGKMYSQVKIPYEGKDASFAWYRQLRSAVFQYGILLKPCEEFQRGKSLCPNKYGNITVTAVRYNEMKGPLYQLPQSPDIVPMTYEDIRGIITKNGAWGDGYRMLYEIMSRIHPILNPDAQTYDELETR